jgi:fatty-acyl-CoA synthase
MTMTDPERAYPRLPAAGAHWVDHITRHAHATPAATAIRFEGSTITWADLAERMNRVASALAARGVKQGSRVAILMTNRPEFIETLLGTNALGAIAVPVNFRLSPHEVAYVLRHSGSAVVATDTLLAPLAAAAAASLESPVHTLVCGLDAGSATPEVESYEAAVEGAPDQPLEVTIDERDIALIMYTSGTTGRPKGAMLTHLNLLMQTFTTLRVLHSNGSGEDANLLNVPLFHIGGIGNLATPFMLGTKTVLMPTAAFDAESTLAVVETEQVTNLFLVPAQWQVMCAHPDATRRTSSLRNISWGAAPATVALLEKMAQTFPHAEIISVFGQTEMSPVTTALPSEEAIRKIGSVGKVIPTISARIVDAFMNDVAQGEVGEIVYRGPSLMVGYWNDPEATAAAYEGGWFHSGDLVREDEEGFVYVVDRAKDMIISGGENIYSAEVENALAGHPALADIVVIGAKHDRWGETPIAVVVASDPSAPPALDDLTDWLRDRLASYKKPTGLVVIDELPRNASGKVLKHELRAKYGNRPV